MLYFNYRGCLVSTGEADSGLRAERYRPRKISTKKQVPIAQVTQPFL